MEAALEGPGPPGGRSNERSNSESELVDSSTESDFWPPLLPLAAPTDDGPTAPLIPGRAVRAAANSPPSAASGGAAVAAADDGPGGRRPGAARSRAPNPPSPWPSWRNWSCPAGDDGGPGWDGGAPRPVGRRTRTPARTEQPSARGHRSSICCVVYPSDSSLSVVLARLVSSGGPLADGAVCALSVWPPSGSPRRRTSNPSEASSSWQPDTRHSRTLSGTSIALSLSVALDGNCATTLRITPMISSAISAPCTSFDSACRVVGDSPSSACRLAEHWDSRSSGSLCGKNTLDGMPLAAGSNRNPTAISRSFQPLTGPALLSMLFCVVYIAFFWPRWMRCKLFSTRCRQTRNASRHLSGVRISSHSACPISATLLDSRTFPPIRMKPAQFAGWAKCFVCCTVCIASASARAARVPCSSAE
uniref:Uncharacterized protein n=1 Tax=Anopheles coluzzii TaxID=1518534 RepID=A0A8W7PTL1_ANOCL